MHKALNIFQFLWISFPFRIIFFPNVISAAVVLLCAYIANGNIQILKSKYRAKKWLMEIFMQIPKSKYVANLCIKWAKGRVPKKWWKYGLLPYPGGSLRVVEKPILLFFMEEYFFSEHVVKNKTHTAFWENYFFPVSCRIILGPPWYGKRP